MARNTLIGPFVVKCGRCGRDFSGKSSFVRYCGEGECQKDKVFRWNKKGRSGVSTSNMGAAIEQAITSRLMLDGWSVFRAAGPNSACDLIAVKSEVTEYIECRRAVYNGGFLVYNKFVNGGDPRPTSYGLYIIETGEVTFRVVKSNARTRKHSGKSRAKPE